MSDTRRLGTSRRRNIVRSAAIRHRRSKRRPRAERWITASRQPRTWTGGDRLKCERPPSSVGLVPNATIVVATISVTSVVQGAGMMTTAAERALAGAENALPERFDSRNVRFHRFARHQGLGVG